ncbi:MAG: ferritin [wastewater metagenome]|nr:ferritin [Candidatus Loosdrechtia aerotolerans]
MINEKMEKAFNRQINAETYSAYLYWSMSAALEYMNLPGFANWMQVQAQEEMTHAVKFFRHIMERGGRVALTAIDGPPTGWKDVEDVFKNIQKHEEHVTSLINDLMDLALTEKDHAAVMFLQWFVTEQVEEEYMVHEILGKLKVAGTASAALYMLDREMAQRVFVPPTTAQKVQG